MSNLREKVLFANATTADVYLALELDPDLYDADTLTLIGGTTTNTGNKPEIPINKRYAIASGLVTERTFKCFRGTGELRKTRDVRLLVSKLKADTIATDATASTKTLKLGRGTAPATWTIESVR